MSISLEAYLMGRDKEYPPTAEMLSGANTLLLRVEALFYDLGIELTDEDLSSGYRPGKYNKAAGGSPRSAHLHCVALDLKDRTRKFRDAILAAPHLLEKHGLYLEDPKHTPTWIHLQTRPTRKRIFIP